MISGFSFSNFKAVSGRASIDCRPITLLFGRNSAGKSTVLQSLALLHHVLNTGETDVYRTRHAFVDLDLGGRPQYAFRGHTSQPTDWEFHEEFDETTADNRHSRIEGFVPQCCTYSVSTPYLEITASEGQRRLFTYRSTPRNDITLGDHASNGRVLDHIYSDLSFRKLKPAVSRTRFGDVMRHLLYYQTSLLTEATHVGARPPWQFGETPSLVLALSAHKQSKRLRDAVRVILDFAFSEARWLGFADSLCHLLMTSPNMRHEEKEVTGNIWGSFERYWQGRGLTWAIAPLDDKELYYDTVGVSLESEYTQLLILEFRLYLARFIQKARHHLDAIRYLGPLRTIPLRGGTTPMEADSLDSVGAADWQRVLADSRTRDTLNEWLGPSRLDTGLSISKKKLYAAKEINALLANLRDGDTVAGGRLNDDPMSTVRHETEAIVLRDVGMEHEVSVADVGIGVAQVLPVLVRALSPGRLLHIIEQPELHLHPALQADLADTFIAGTTRPDEDGRDSRTGHKFILETHSEHLILRLLRRIRETSEGDAPVGLSLTPEDVAVYYVDRTESGAVIQEIKVSPAGEFMTPWPRGFFPERLRELE